MAHARLCLRDMIDTDLMLRAYANGIFPMSDTRDDAETYWVEPPTRAILPLERLHISKSLAKTVRQDRFAVTSDTAFAEVIQLCAAPAGDRAETWINHEIEEAFLALHEKGYAHSVECWQDGDLVGGLYGLAIGRAFCGESMFSRRNDASKVALVWLVTRMVAGGFTLLDCQFLTGHLARLGVIEIPQNRYLALLADALEQRGQVSATGSASAASSAGASSGDWGALGGVLDGGFAGGFSSPGKRIMQLLTQTS